MSLCGFDPKQPIINPSTDRTVRYQYRIEALRWMIFYDGKIGIPFGQIHGVSTSTAFLTMQKSIKIENTQFFNRVMSQTALHENSCLMSLPWFG